MSRPRPAEAHPSTGSGPSSHQLLDASIAAALLLNLRLFVPMGHDSPDLRSRFRKAEQVRIVRGDHAFVEQELDVEGPAPEALPNGDRAY